MWTTFCCNEIRAGTPSGQWRSRPAQLLYQPLRKLYQISHISPHTTVRFTALFFNIGSLNFSQLFQESLVHFPYFGKRVRFVRAPQYLRVLHLIFRISWPIFMKLGMNAGEPPPPKVVLSISIWLVSTQLTTLRPWSVEIIHAKFNKNR
jgi:hypothetical protein